MNHMQPSKWPAKTIFPSSLISLTMEGLRCRVKSTFAIFLESLRILISFSSRIPRTTLRFFFAQFSMEEHRPRETFDDWQAFAGMADKALAKDSSRYDARKNMATMVPRYFWWANYSPHNKGTMFGCENSFLKARNRSTTITFLVKHDYENPTQVSTTAASSQAGAAVPEKLDALQAVGTNGGKHKPHQRGDW